MKYLCSFLVSLELCLLLVSSTYAQENKETIHPDQKAPIMHINADKPKSEEASFLLNITVERDSAFAIKDYIEIQEKSEEYRVVLYGKYDIHQNGSYPVTLIVMDKKGNSSSQEVVIQVVDPKPNKTIRYITREKLEDSLASNGSSSEGKAKEMATQFVGMKGWCTDVANAFLASFYGEGVNCFNTYPVAASEARPGDVIYYADGGLGAQHYAIYLGGNQALQGNFLGSAQIRDVYINKASEPQFSRPVIH